MADGSTGQQSLDLYRELNRYDGRDEDWPSDEVFEPPRRTLANGWRKFHAARDCGSDNLAFVEDTNMRMPSSKRYDYRLHCLSCGHKILEDEVLFIGDDWYGETGWKMFHDTIENLWLPNERVLELGPDPDREALRDALWLTRVEKKSGPSPMFSQESYEPCEDCGAEVPVRFDDRCRMCYDGPWTDRLQQSVNALERRVRVWHNDSFVHRLPGQVDPLNPGSAPSTGTILWRRHETEGTSKLVEVTGRLEDVDDGHMVYVLQDPTHTRQWQYREEDLQDCFWDTSLYNDESKPVLDDRIREVYQRVCDHSFHDVHDPETHEVAGQQCIHCRKRRDGDNR